MPPVLIVRIGREARWDTLRQPAWEELDVAIEALGTTDVFEMKFQGSVYLPQENERAYGAELTILGENGRYHARVWHIEDAFCYRGGEPSAEGEYYFAKADQGCGERGLSFPLSQVGTDKGVVREIARQFWKTGGWVRNEHWVPHWLPED